MSPEQAASAGVHVHGLAADLWRARHGGADGGPLAGEVADQVPAVLAALAQGRIRCQFDTAVRPFGRSRVALISATYVLPGVAPALRKRASRRTR